MKFINDMASFQIKGNLIESYKFAFIKIVDSILLAHKQLKLLL